MYLNINEYIYGVCPKQYKNIQIQKNTSKTNYKLKSHRHSRMFKYSPDTTLHIVCCNVRSSDSISTVDNNVFIYRQASQKLQQYM